ncbi:hypothetical protein [Kocuria sabuli]|uniref:hypothetical protein n=1 Tax=Kocuria sabuli TaxID=3071448 RepID=UPI0034D6B91B
MRRPWFHYFTLGGHAGEIEGEACLHRCLDLPRLQRDLVTHAANELVHRQPPLRAPYTWDLHRPPGRAAQE